MPMIFQSKDSDFALDQLGYEVSRGYQFFSLQGGVFSYSGDAGQVSLLHGGSTFPARAELPFRVELYDLDDGTPIEHEDRFLESIASILRARMPFDERSRMSGFDSSSTLIFSTEVDAANTAGLPTLGSVVEIADKNGQTISALLIGVTLSENSNLMICWFALTPEQAQVPSFKSIDDV